MVDKLIKFASTNKTNKLAYIMMGAPFLYVCVSIYLRPDSVTMADFHRHLGEYTKWVAMTFFGGGAMMKSIGKLKE